MSVYLSIIIPVFNEAENLPELISRLMRVIKKNIKKSYEIIFIDDGSTDKTWNLIEKYHKKNKSIKGISFVRNFGHQYALTAGMKEAKGKLIFMLDGDLQHPPELLRDFKNKYDEGYEIIAGVRDNKEELSLLKKSFSRFYYWLFNRLSQTRLIAGTSDFRLVSRRVADFIIKLSENDKFYRALFPWSGFQTFYFSYSAQKRARGKAKFSFLKSFYMGLEGVISFSTKPLTLSIYLGFFIAGLAFIYGLYAIYGKLFLHQGQPGITYLIASIIFISGVQMVIMGIIGIYIGRITRQLMGRPEYLIRSYCGL